MTTTTFTCGQRVNHRAQRDTAQPGVGVAVGTIVYVGITYPLIGPGTPVVDVSWDYQPGADPAFQGVHSYRPDELDHAPRLPSEPSPADVYAALPVETRTAILDEIFEILEYDEEGNPGAEVNGGDLVEALAELFQKHGVRFTPVP